MKAKPKEHLYWIDWMKFLGMYFIIAGHIFPIGHEYIYVFSVPLFFAISGFLSHHTDSIRIFWKKLFQNLIIPCLIICLLLHLISIVEAAVMGRFEVADIPKHIINCILGNQGRNSTAGGIGICWFIYTLILCKVIYQFVCNKPEINGIVVILCIAIAVYYNQNELHFYNSVANTTLAYPLFVAGGGYKRMRINDLCNDKRILALGAVLSFIIVWIIGYYNGAPWMFNNTYGKHIVLFFIGGLVGSMGVFFISFLLKDIKLKAVQTISRGSIVVLGFHQLIIKLYDHSPALFHSTWTDYSVALLILLLFVPIIILIERFFPIILGQRARNK